MAQLTHIYNPETQLWYPVTVTIIDGEATTTVDENGGILTPPPYIADAGTPLISTDHFLCFTGLSSLPVGNATWTAFASTVSDAIENYCRKSWRVLGEEVPLQVMLACSLATRDLLGSKNGSTGMYKSYSGGDYSWTLQDGIEPGNFLAPYKAMLNAYRELTVYA